MLSCLWGSYTFWWLEFTYWLLIFLSLWPKGDFSFFCCCCFFFFSFFVFVFLLFFFYEYVNVPIIDQVHNNEKLFIKEGEWAYRLQTCHEKQIITCRVSASCFSVRFIFSISAHACYVLLNQSSLFFVMRTVCSLSDGSLTFLCNGF